MIKIIIKEQATRAGTAAAGSQAIKSYYNPNQTKTKAKTKEATPVTDTESSQPQQEPEETKPKGIVPSNWKPEIGTEIELKGVKYKANSTGGWLPNGIGLPISKTSPIFSTLNTLAYNEEQKKKGQSTSTTAPLEPEDQETEEAQRQPQQTSQINFEELWDQVHDKTQNPFTFYESVEKFLLGDETYGDKYRNELDQLEELITKQFEEIQTKKKWKDRVDNATKFVSDVVLEQKQINEVIDPATGLAILVGSITAGGVYGVYKKNKNVQDARKTPEGQYLIQLALKINLINVVEFLQNPNGYLGPEGVQWFSKLINDEMKKYNEFSINPFRKNSLLKQMKEEVKDYSESLEQFIVDQTIPPTKSINESTIKRWKLIAGIRG